MLYICVLITNVYTLFIFSMKKYILPLLVVFSLFAAPNAYAQLNGELQSLNDLLKSKSMYDARKQAQLDSLKKLMSVYKMVTPSKIDLCIELGEEYQLFKADSSLVYFERAQAMARELNDNYYLLIARLKKLRPEIILGFHAEARDDFESINVNEIPEALKSYYYEAGYRINSFALNSLGRDVAFYGEFSTRTRHFRDKWVASLPQANIQHRLYSVEQAIDAGKLELGKTLALDLVEDLPVSTNEYGIAAAMVAFIYDQVGDNQKAINYYIKSAKSDIICSVKENAAIFRLAMMLFDMGYIDNAYNYIYASIEDAAFCNAQVRVYNASKMLPVIESSHRAEVRQHERMLKGYVIAVSLLAVGLVIAIFFLMRQMKKLSEARRKLVDANSIKDEYMGQFLGLCSVYMKRLDVFTKLVGRKLSLGQAEDLYKQIKSNKFNEDQHKGFYEEFDNAFLKIYPTFIDDVNNLLNEDDHFSMDVPNRLNTELRIFALLRLGINDSSKIAEFLKYSVNTIYTYRNRVKNKAKNRESFEDDIMKIGVIE